MGRQNLIMGIKNKDGIKRIMMENKEKWWEIKRNCGNGKKDDGK